MQLGDSSELVTIKIRKLVLSYLGSRIDELTTCRDRLNDAVWQYAHCLHFSPFQLVPYYCFLDCFGVVNMAWPAKKHELVKKEIQHRTLVLELGYGNTARRSKMQELHMKQITCEDNWGNQAWECLGSVHIAPYPNIPHALGSTCCKAQAFSSILAYC